MSEPYDPEEPLPPYDSDTDPDDGTYFSDNDKYFLPNQTNKLFVDQRGFNDLASHIGPEHRVNKHNPLTARPTGLVPNKTNVGTTTESDPSVPGTSGLNPKLVPEAEASNQATLQTIQTVNELQKSIARMQSQLPTLSASQKIAELTEELSLTSLKSPTSPNPSTYLFDPTGLFGDKYFSGAPDDVYEYLTKYFAQPLHTQLTAEMAKHFKRPDIPVMRVQKLDDMFQRKGHSFMKARDYTFKEIHKDPLHAVGPIAELLAKLTNGQQVEPNKLILYISGTLILMGSSAARILTARRKNAVRAKPLTYNRRS